MARVRALDEEEARLPRPGRDRDALAGELAAAQARWAALTVAAQNAILRRFILRVTITGHETEVCWVDDVRRIAETD